MYRLRDLLNPDDPRSLPHLEEPPIDVNYLTAPVVGLQKKYDKYFALRVRCVLSQTLDVSTLEEITPIPIVEEKYTYAWGADGLPTSQGKEIRFYLEDGSLNSQPDKILPGKVLESGDREQIVTNRRKDMVDYLKARAKELGLVDPDSGQNLIELFFDNYYQEVDRYIAAGKTDLIDEVAASTLTWFDIDLSAATGGTFATVRNAIATNLQKALEIPTTAEIEAFLNA